MPKEKTEEALSIIQKNVGSLQRKLNRRLSMRWVPYLIFELDKGEISAQNLEETLKDK
jgi:ribosome-binding factor A